MDEKLKIPQDYFNKRVFRAGFILMFLLLLAVWASADFDLGKNIYMECPKDVTGGYCINPFYGCGMNLNPVLYDCPLKSKDIKEYCEGGICEREFLYPGESLGKKPSILYNESFFIVFLILLSCFIVNDLIYRKRGGKV